MCLPQDPQQGNMVARVLPISEQSPLDQHTFSSLRLYIMVETKTGAPSVVLTPLPLKRRWFLFSFLETKTGTPLVVFTPPPPTTGRAKPLIRVHAASSN